MSDIPAGPADAAEQWVRSWSASASARASAAQSLSDQVARLSVSASDRERRITVTVNGSGGMTDLRLETGAGGGDMDQLAADILRTMRQAQAALAQRVAVIAGHTVGSDSETARAVVSSFERRFPARAEDDDSNTSGEPRRGW